MNPIASTTWAKIAESREKEFAVKTAVQIKSHGVHYTPPELSGFLARSIIAHLQTDTDTIRVLDPACGDGGLLLAFAEELPADLRKKLVLVGYDRDGDALDEAGAHLNQLDVKNIELYEADFLEFICQNYVHLSQRSLFGVSKTSQQMGFDAVISNPPYVRTQVLGATMAQKLANSFNLKGRLDLYQAFTIGMTTALRKGGILGLLTSNRFLTTQSGSDLRNHLKTEYEMKAVYDLGDTKLFSAAVLPVIVIGEKNQKKQLIMSIFDRVYEYRSKNATEKQYPKFPSVLKALESNAHGIVQTPKGLFSIERGNLATTNDPTEPWSLVSAESRRWLACVIKHQDCTFDDVVKIKVGIKTTADNVFIRNNWNDLPSDLLPESILLHPLIRHTEAARWNAISTNSNTKVLYPYVSENGKRTPIDLRKYPNCKNYLESHVDQLKGRKYVIESGRKWYEIWVPHNPADWSKLKIIFPDISEKPKFFLEASDSIVNGDCYWITLRENKHQDWLYLLLAIANSSFIVAYYDTMFHNKLYAGRRRFMTQYVKKFPLPSITSTLSKEIIDLVKQLVSTDINGESFIRIEEQLDNLVWQSFGLEEPTR